MASWTTLTSEHAALSLSDHDPNPLRLPCHTTTHKSLTTRLHVPPSRASLPPHAHSPARPTPATMLSRLAVLPLLLGAVSAQSSSNYTTELVNTLSGAGLTTLADYLRLVSTEAPGQALLNSLTDESKNFTVFAPNNGGCAYRRFRCFCHSLMDIFLGAGAFPNATTNASDPGLLSTLAYHVVHGSFNNLTQTYPNTTIGRTTLNNSDLVRLEGNKAQVLAWSMWPSDNKIHILNQK